MVIAQAHDAGAEADVTGAACGGGDKYLGRGYGLPASAVMLADPGFVEPEVVQPLDQLQISLQGQCRVLTHPVKGGHKRPEGHVIG